PPHWRRGVKTGIWPDGEQWKTMETTIVNPDLPPYFGYGEPTFAHWRKGVLYTLRNANQIPTLKDYLKVQALSFYAFPADMFWGYYKYQIENKFPRDQGSLLMSYLLHGQVDNNSLNELLRLGVQNGRGKLRTEGDTCITPMEWDYAADKPKLYTRK